MIEYPTFLAYLGTVERVSYIFVQMNLLPSITSAQKCGNSALEMLCLILRNGCQMVLKSFFYRISYFFHFSAGM